MWREGRPFSQNEWPPCIHLCYGMHVARSARYQLGELQFYWDEDKYDSNIRKHGVTFEEAATSWLDRRAIERFDEAHSDKEERWLRIGMSLRSAVLVSWSTERSIEGKLVIRIIGARRANRRERQVYGREKDSTWR